MALPNPLRLIGMPPSPYTRKMVALLRYRRIPYSIKWADAGSELEAMGIEDKPKYVFLPTFLFDKEEGGIQAVCDSTPIIHRLEKEVTDRSVIPSDPALAFINFVLEDFGDEWCTKYMFHYRWYPEVDAENAGTILMTTSGVTMSDETLKQFKDYFTERQVGRLSYVGSCDTTAPVIDASYRRFLGLMEEHFKVQPYLLGARPGSADFSVFGQFTQLIGVEPTSRAIAHEVSPRMVGWMMNTEDLCGLEPQESDWTVLDEAPATLKAIMGEVGRVYVPALLANAKANAAGEKEWETEIDGVTWKQRTFPYQTKCLQWINEEYQALTDSDKARVDAILDGTGCEAMLQASK